jgi:hypothetical protein
MAVDGILSITQHIHLTHKKLSNVKKDAEISFIELLFRNISLL